MTLLRAIRPLVRQQIDGIIMVRWRVIASVWVGVDAWIGFLQKICHRKETFTLFQNFVLIWLEKSKVRDK